MFKVFIVIINVIIHILIFFFLNADLLNSACQMEHFYNALHLSYAWCCKTDPAAVKHIEYFHRFMSTSFFF